MIEAQNAEEHVHSLVGSLETIDLQDLRALWRSRWGSAPRMRSATLLRHIIAWRLQAEMHGGLDGATCRLLASSLPLTRCIPPAGTRLRREFRGTVHEVEVLQDDFRYGGRDFTNLTAIAEVITGKHWPGPRFFGLRERINRR